MRASKRATVNLCGLAILLAAVGMARAEETKPTYPTMALMQQYRMASTAAEAALARSAAPESISKDASVMTLGEHGYETTQKGKNGFVCIVWRSWTAGFSDAEFWNPKLRAPICLNPAAVRTILPTFLERTEWVITGASKSEMLERTKAAVAAKHVVTPESGAMGFMMSRQGYLGDSAGHWHPHLMIFLGRTEGADWGADLHGSPVFAAQGDPEPVTTFIVPVPRWADGSAAAMKSD